MSSLEPVKLQLSFLGTPMGTLAYRADLPAYALELTTEFIGQGHDLSPLTLPLDTFRQGARLFRPGDTPFHAGLPGLIADSLPDLWGERMLRQEIPGLQTVLGKLAAIGQRGPGAITFAPVIGSGGDQITTTSDLRQISHQVDELRKTPEPLTSEAVTATLARAGSSLGGKFPKISAHLPLGECVFALQSVLTGGATPDDYSPCILKLASSSDEAEGAVEYAYYLMALKAGIRVPRACLVDDGERLHFASERFDRYRMADGTIGRRHVHTLSGMMQRRAADGAIDYEDFLRLSRALGGAPEAEECFRRAVFNLLAVNRDDHGRNHAFLYDESTRAWKMAPAYDLNPNVANVLIGLSWLSRLEIPKEHSALTRLAQMGDIRPARALEIYSEVEGAVFQGWRECAKQARVPEAMSTYWEKEMLQQTKALRADVAGVLSKHARLTEGTVSSTGRTRTKRLRR